jgi:hypothetical protein
MIDIIKTVYIELQVKKQLIKKINFSSKLEKAND